MIPDWAGKVWKKMPYRIRRLIVRTTQHTFTVSAAAVITRSDGRILILKHAIRPRWAWGIPGGFIEHGESPDAGLRREIKEETGLQLSEVRMLFLRTLGGHIEMIFKAKAEGEPVIDGSEITDVGWFAAEDLPEEMSSHDKVLIERVIRGDFGE